MLLPPLVQTIASAMRPLDKKLTLATRQAASMHSLQITEHQGGLWGMVVGQQKTVVTERVTETLIVQARVSSVMLDNIRYICIR